MTRPTERLNVTMCEDLPVHFAGQHFTPFIYLAGSEHVFTLEVQLLRNQFAS